VLLAQEVNVAATENFFAPITRLWEAFCDILTYLEGAGGWKLRSLHQAVIDRVVSFCDPATSSKIILQLEQKYFVQFMPKGQISTFFFKRLPEELLIPDPKFLNCLFKVELIVDGRKQHANVIFVKGRILSIEFKKPYEFYMGKDVKIGEVAEGQPKDSFTAIIDRAEHGRETDENP
jgi:hypothetical protein